MPVLDQSVIIKVFMRRGQVKDLRRDLGADRDVICLFPVPTSFLRSQWTLTLIAKFLLRFIRRDHRTVIVAENAFAAKTIVRPLILAGVV